MEGITEDDYSDDKREVPLDELNDFIDSGGTDKGSSCSWYAPPEAAVGSVPAAVVFISGYHGACKSFIEDRYKHV